MLHDNDSCRLEFAAAAVHLTSAQEQVLRMRLGLGVQGGTPLSDKAGNNDALRSELLLLEGRLRQSYGNRPKHAHLRLLPSCAPDAEDV